MEEILNPSRMATSTVNQTGAMRQLQHERAVELGQYGDDHSEDDKGGDYDGYLDIGTELLAALDAIESSGTFASKGELPYVDPQINVHDVGTITLPLQESQARQMIDKAHHAPYGKGSETLVDTAVRNTWELNPDQFEFGNPEWDKYIEEACACAARDLGVDSPVSAELYKMLIYEKGAMFKPHTDTEKAPGMFATLVIGLPSLYEGGEVAVKHQGDRMILETSKHGFSYVSWYSDVIHEVLPVRSGYRWVLTYNLCIDPSRQRPTACLQTDEARYLHEVLEDWIAQEDRDWSHAYYRLDHEYTQANISLNALKGRDLASVHLLQEISKTLDVEIFLALITKSEMGSCEYQGSHGRRSYYDDDYGQDEDYYGRSEALHDLEEIFDTSYEITSLVDLDGSQVVKKMPFEMDNVLQEKCFDEVDPEEAYEGYQGNSGPTATHWYRVAAVVMVPRDSIADFFLDSWKKSNPYSHNIEKNMTSVIGFLAKSLLHNSGDELLRETLKELCRKVWTVDESNEVGRYRYKTVLPEPVITKVLQVAIVLKDQELIKDVADHHEGNLSLDFFKWAQEQLAAGAVAFDSIKDSLLRTILVFPELWKRQVAVNHLVPHTEPISDDVRSWVEIAHDGILEMIPRQELGPQDGHAVVDMIPGYHDFDYLSSRVAPLVEGRLPATSFILAFLSRLDQYTTQGAFPAEDGTNLYRQVAKSLANKIDIYTLVSEGGDEESAAKLGILAFLNPRKPQSTPHSKSLVVTHETLADFISTLIRINSDSDSMMGFLSRRICFRAPAIKSATLHSLWLPFLHALNKICETNSIPSTTPDYRQIFAAILKAYITNYVGEKPIEDTSSVRPTVTSCCGDCTRLNAFLTNPDATVGRFPVNKQRRQHLHQKLDQAGIDCTHETERWGSPQTLVVTKSFRHHEVALAAWKKRKGEAAHKLLDFNKSDLTVWLGDDYQHLMGMVDLGHPSGQRSARAAPTSQRLAPISSNQQTRPTRPSTKGYGRLFPQIAGTKRKAADADVVDLTGDD